MKNFIIITILVLSISSCKGILDTEPEEYISDASVITDATSARAALVGVYDALQSYYGAYLVAHNNIADNVVGNSTRGIIIPTLTAAGSSAFDPTSAGGYTSAYIVINRANFVISKTAALSGNSITESLKNQYEGQAYFLRALTYFSLVRTYGGVPLISNPTQSASQDNGIKRGSTEETYAQVLSDLDQAENLLSNTTTVDRNWINLYTVFALKARYYLYTENWDKAEEYASKVIADTKDFTLIKPFSSFFTTIESKESIFELTFSASDQNPIYTYYLSSAEGGRLDYIAEPGFVTQLLDPDLGGTRSALVKKLSDGAYAVAEYGNQDGSSSLSVLRFAEQYLIRAEARVKKSTPDFVNAISDLNAIKSRAEVPLFNQDPSSVSANDILLAIENERRFELAFEGHRFSDIVRTGRAVSVFGPLNTLFTDPGRWVFPIPYSVISADPDIEQNETYK